LLKGLPQTGIYVSLMKGREVRVCMGSFHPGGSGMARAIKGLAGKVIFGDTRARPLSLSEMGELSLVLSFTGPLKEIQDPYAVDYSREGLLISQDGRQGVLLPGETRTLHYGIQRLMKQNGIDSKRPCRYASFQAVVFDERRPWIMTGQDRSKGRFPKPDERSNP
jgi:AMMECR1 domain-containing protein